MGLTQQETTEFLNGYQAARKGEPMNKHETETWQDGWRFWFLHRFTERRKSA